MTERTKDFNPLPLLGPGPGDSGPGGLRLQHSDQGPAVGAKFTLRLDKVKDKPWIAEVGPLKGELVGYKPGGFIFTLEETPGDTWIVEYGHPGVDLFEFEP